ASASDSLAMTVAAGGSFGADGASAPATVRSVTVALPRESWRVPGFCRILSHPATTPRRLDSLDQFTAQQWAVHVRGGQGQPGQPGQQRQRGEDRALHAVDRPWPTRIEP